MTTETGASEAAVAQSRDAAAENSGKTTGGVLHWLRAVVDAAASGKVTAALLFAAMLLILVGTLAQVYHDIWAVVEDYFRTWLCWIELKVLFPPSFFPWAAHTDWGALKFTHIPFPGGASIGLALVINLTAAHAIRFQVQARGARLWGGLLVLAAGVATTWWVIEAGHNRQGLQGAPPLEWSALWLLIQIGLAVLWLVCLAGLAYVLWKGQHKRLFIAVILGSAALGIGLLLGWTLLKGEAAALTDSSLRILYQLIQGQVAALVLLAACVLLFRRRAGLVLLHGGVGLLMFGELFVSYFAEEQQMTLRENQTVSYTRDIRSVELAITTLFHGDRNQVVAIPTATNGKATHFTRGETVELEGFPFQLEILRYYKNSTIRAAGSNDTNLATQGMGTQYIAEQAPPEGGVQGGQLNLASAYVKFANKDGSEDLGTLLVSQHFAPRIVPDGISVGGNAYGVQLRFKHSYKPYRVTLVDVRKDDYVGTNMPRNYSSQVRLQDPSRNVDFETRIWMNNPLRYAGETFYQSGYNIDARGGESSTLQVVKNTGWMIPYVACMIAATGMLAHFFVVLLRFLRQGSPGDPAGASGEEPPAMARPEARREAEIPLLARWLVPLAVVVLAVFYIAGKAAAPRSPVSQFQLEEFGELPVMYEGRVKPLDTLARNSLRIISNRETFVDASGQKRPAIGWLLDVIARPEAAEQHRVFRIENLEVLAMLGLERRSGFRYSWEELRPSTMEFQKQVMLAQQRAPEQRTLQQRKLLELSQRVGVYRLLADSFRPLALPSFPTPEQTRSNREEAVKTVAEISRLTKAIVAANRTLKSMQCPMVAVGSSDQPWQPYALAKNTASSNQHVDKQPPAPALSQLAAVFAAYQQDDPGAFNAAVSKYQGLLSRSPPPGWDPRITGFEAYFNHFAPFYHAIPLYFAALALTTLAWLAAAWPRASALMRSSAFWLIVFALAIHTLAICGRVAISGRPPVTNLYSSAIFVGWGCVVLGLLLELVFHLGVGNFVSAVAGIGGLMIAHFLAGEGDTIRVLQAVLDTQFWLTTHVLTVAMGYSATFLAGLLGLVLVGYLACEPLVPALAGLRRSSRRRRREGDALSSSRGAEVERILGGMIYGTICFAAFFSFVGTVLGGLWADDSWGRFWGWDPKENGALIVVLWSALVLHLRSAKMVKQRGLALLAVGGNIVTSWSWFGVNELGIGLHSYGFTDGVARALLMFWTSQFVVIGLALLAMAPGWLNRRPTDLKAAAG